MSRSANSLTALRGAIEQAAEIELKSRLPNISPEAVGHAHVVAADLAAVLVSEVLRELGHPAQFVASREDHITTDKAGDHMDNAVACVVSRL